MTIADWASSRRAALVANSGRVFVYQPVAFDSAHALEAAATDTAAPVMGIRRLFNGRHGEARRAAHKPAVYRGVHCWPPFRAASVASVRELRTAASGRRVAMLPS